MVARGNRAPLDGRLQDIESRLSRIEEPSLLARRAGPVPDWLVPALGELLGCERPCAYRPHDDDGSWGLGECVTVPDDTFFSRYDAAMRQTPAPFCYDPLHPGPAQRNRALLIRELHTHGPETTCIIDDVWPRLGLSAHDQLRALVCAGPVLLAWVGGFRQEPFSEHERGLLSALLPSMQRAFALRRVLLDAGVVQAGLAEALEAVGAPAFVARREGTVTHANASGAALLAGLGSAVRGRLRAAIDGHEGRSSVARLDAPGLPESFLVILRDDDLVLSARLAEAQRRWGVTRRELDVLRWVVDGDCNKEIALKLGLHEGSVERHVTSLLRKGRCDSRSRLVARFWTAF